MDKNKEMKKKINEEWNPAPEGPALAQHLIGEIIGPYQAEIMDYTQYYSESKAAEQRERLDWEEDEEEKA
ncbi:MAG: hypothetical protein Q4B42_07240 [Oscillospiraceae bacterium]|nr:hypothetical protein [Oscillospiraceae bacterium]